MAKVLKIFGITLLVLIVLLLLVVFLRGDIYLFGPSGLTEEQCLEASGRIVTLEEQVREGRVKGEVIGNIWGTQDGRICVVED